MTPADSFSMLAKLAAAVAVASVLFTAGVAHADEPAPEKPQTETRWYGYQTLAADGSALAFAALSGVSDGRAGKDMFGVAALGSYAIAPAIIHAVNGHPWKGIGDTAIRVLAPIGTAFVGGLIGAAVSPRSSDAITDAATGIGSIMEGMEIGLLVGIAGAVALDAAVLTHDEVPVSPPKSTASITPTAAPTRDGFMAGLGGRF